MSFDILDAHVHLWDLEHVHLSWFDGELGLPERVTAAELQRDARPGPRGTRSVGGAIAVQAGDTLAEARWLVAQAASNPFVRAVVLQYGAGDHAAAWAGTVHEALVDSEADAPHGSAGAHVAGIRLATPSGAPDFGDVAGLEGLADGLARTGRVLELLIRPAHLPAVAALARRHPELSIVICHLALGRAEPGAEWRRGIDLLASATNVSAKFSGMDAGLPGELARLAPVADLAFAAFGADRLMFGSDWPMSGRTMRYREVLTRTAAVLPHLGRQAAGAFWSGTATRLYGLRDV